MTNEPTVTPEATGPVAEKADPDPLNGAAGVNVIPVEGTLLIVITSERVDIL